MTTLPKTVYVEKVEADNDPYLMAYEEAGETLSVGEEKTLGVYNLIGFVKVKTSVSIEPIDAMTITPLATPSA